MPCESCAVQFSVFRRRRACPECERSYCAGCLRRGGGAMCAACRTLSTRPLTRQTVTHLKVRDLQCFLHKQNVSTRGCVEKDELVNLCISHVNSSAYRKRTARSSSSTFNTLKGFTNNINEFINNTFDIRTGPLRTGSHSQGSCYNNAHAHYPENDNTGPVDSRYSSADMHTSLSPEDLLRTHVIDNPHIERPMPPPPEMDLSHTSSCEDRIETSDCYEIEDLDDAGWEVVTRPAEPLPNDSEVLLSEAVSEQPPRPSTLDVIPEPNVPQRATSVLDLRSPTQEQVDTTDTNSLKDEHEPCIQTVFGPNENVQLGQIHDEKDLGHLTVRQLKLLLTTNRVEYKGCVERIDLLQRALILYRDHAQYREQIDNLPIEECCKICMAAPLECILLECGHMATCTQCGKQLAECPICRQYVVRAIRFFRS